jgi:predicted methyltransferase MtxX (methanogen marker protein 4)
LRNFAHAAPIAARNEMADRNKERAARNRDLIASMAAPPTRAQILVELDLEITDAIRFATGQRGNRRVMFRGLVLVGGGGFSGAGAPTADGESSGGGVIVCFLPPVS